METLKLHLDDDPAYRRLLGDHRIEEYGDMEIATIQQDNGMVCVCIGFTVCVHPQPGSGAIETHIKVSAVTSGKFLKAAVEAMQVAHPGGKF